MSLLAKFCFLFLRKAWEWLGMMAHTRNLSIAEKESGWTTKQDRIRQRRKGEEERGINRDAFCPLPTSRQDTHLQRENISCLLSLPWGTQSHSLRHP